VQTQPNRPLAQLIARFREPVTTLLATWPELLAPERRAVHAAALAELAGAGLEPALAQRLVCLRHTDQALEVAQIGHAANVPLTTAAQGYFATADLIDLDWLRETLPSTLTGEDRWDPRAASSLLETLLDLRRQLTLQVLGYHRDGTPIDECLRAYAATCREQLDVVSGLIVDLGGCAATLPALLVLMREIARLARPGERGRPW
jgi:NAD-specific glutamate dehydrogenase